MHATKYGEGEKLMHATLTLTNLTISLRQILIFWASKQFFLCICFETYFVLKLDRFEEELVLFSSCTFRTCLRFETRPF